MIDKHELRIGNIVPLWRGQWSVVSALRKDSAVVIWDGLDHVMSYNDLQPIELTEDILLKCAEITKDELIDNESTKGATFPIKGTDLYLKYEFNQAGEMLPFSLIKGFLFQYLVIADVKYIHVLQNAVFFLTGKELQIDLK